MVITSVEALADVPQNVTFPEVILQRIRLWPHRPAIVSTHTVYKYYVLVSLNTHTHHSCANTYMYMFIYIRIYIHLVICMVIGAHVCIWTDAQDWAGVGLG